jgi:hypothetical protein
MIDDVTLPNWVISFIYYGDPDIKATGPALPAGVIKFFLPGLGEPQRL